MQPQFSLFFLLVILNMFSFCGPPKPESPSPQAALPQKTEAELIADLDSPVWSTKTEAILELSTYPSQNYLSKFRKLLVEDPHPNVRGTVAIALGELKDTQSTPAILDLLSPTSGVSTDVVLDALHRMGDSRGAAPILKYLDSDDHAIRLKVVETLSLLNNPAVGKQILEMAKKCNDEEKKKTYAMVLGKLHIRESEDWLVAVATKTPPSPTLAASYLALGRVGSKKGIPLLAKALGGEFDKGRENATQALIEIKDKSALPYLYDYLESSNREIRYYAANVMVEIPDESLVSKCTKLLDESKVNSIGVASYILGRLKIENARPKIEDALQQKANPEREVIAQALGWIRNKKSIPILISVLEEKDGEGRYGAAWALGVIGDRDGFSALEKASGSSDFRLASMATESLGSIHIPEVIPVMEKRISENKNLSVFALRAIANVPGDEASKSLEKYAKSVDPTIFTPAIENIGLRKQKQSIPFLIDILKEKDSPKKRIASAALNNLTGKHFFSSQEWIMWYESEGK
jgi:HEAT repeat protein